MSNVGSSMKFFDFSSNGMSRDTLGLITMPLIVVKLIVPFILSRTHRPLVWFARLYPPRLLICVFIGVYVFFTSQLIRYPYVFYTFLITLFVFNETLIYLQLVSRVGFYAQISEPRIGGTYMTLVSTVGNIGQTVSSSAVLYLANWLPKKQAYFIEVGICTAIGIVWLLMSWRMMHRLQAQPVEKWYIMQDDPSTIGPATEEAKGASNTTISTLAPAP